MGERGANAIRLFDGSCLQCKRCGGNKDLDSPRPQPNNPHLSTLVGDPISQDGKQTLLAAMSDHPINGDGE